MQGKVTYTFEAIIWQHTGPNGWYFVSMPIDMAAEIRANLKWQEEGWGRMNATAKIGSSTWQTAIWFDTKQNTYLLPLNAAIRKKEKLHINQKILVVVGV
ncbi:MAG: DUF1905 domain-containing protein [Chitinophagaceae bacterium]